MSEFKQALLGVLAALMLGVIVFGSLLLALVENDLQLAEMPDQIMALGQPVFTPEPVFAAEAAPIQNPEELQQVAESLSISENLNLPQPSCPVPAGWMLYRVMEEDTPASLAQAYGLSLDEFFRYNCIDIPVNSLPAGNTVYLPRIQALASLSAEEAAQESNSPHAAAARKKAVKCGPPSWWLEYRVRAGDTLYQLGLATGVSVAEIQRSNCLGGSTIIRTGQGLYLPAWPSTAAELSAHPKRPKPPVKTTLPPIVVTTPPSTEEPPTDPPPTEETITPEPTDPSPTEETTTPEPTDPSPTDDTTTPQPSPEPATTEQPTVEPQPSDEPPGDPAQTEEPTVEPQPSEEPSAEPAQTEEPVIDPVVTDDPTGEPQPSEEPAEAPQPSTESKAEPQPTDEASSESQSSQETAGEPAPVEASASQAEPVEVPASEPDKATSPDDQQSEPLETTPEPQSNGLIEGRNSLASTNPPASEFLHSVLQPWYHLVILLAIFLIYRFRSG